MEATGIDAIAGGKLVLQFNCSPGTGYSWNMKTSGDTILAKKTETECKPDDAAAKGSGFTQTDTLHRSEVDAVKTEVESAGFTLDGAQCIDIDECVKNAAGCDVNAECVNLPGSVACSAELLVGVSL